MLAWGLTQLAGALLVLLPPHLPHAGTLLICGPLALAAAVAKPRWRWLAALWIGAALAWMVATERLSDRFDPSLEGEVVEIVGMVTGLIEEDGRRQQFRFRVESGSLGKRALALPSNVRLSVYEPISLRTGERWQLRVKLRRPRGFGNPGGFDYERWLFTQDIGATGYVRDVRAARRLDEARHEWRAHIAGSVAELASGPAAGLVRGLATADRRGISDAQWEVLRATGTAHLMAISGLHIGLVSGLGLMLVAFARRRFFPERGIAWPPLLGGVLALVYGALAGFGLPVRRALVAAGVVLAALAWRRNLASGHAFGFALTAVLCLDPLAPLDTGFWMSFGAVAAILYVLAGRRPAGSKLAAVIRVQLGLFLLLAPLTAMNFGQLPLVSPLANLVAIPLFGFVVVPLVLLALLFLWWPPVAAYLLGWAGNVLDLLLLLLEGLAGLAPPIAPAQPGVGAWLLALLALLILIAPRALPGRFLALWLLLPVIVTFTLRWTPDENSPPLALHFLDVGQGLSVIVETPESTLVYDTGPRFGGSDAASMAVIPFLEARGRRPDIVMISHGDSDHAGGLGAFLSRYPGSRFVGRARPPHELEDCASAEWQWQSVKFRVLDTGARREANDNDASCVLRVEYGGFVALLTGDIEAGAEARLVAKHAPHLKADVALAPHHGSRTSSTSRLVNAVRPALTIAAAGYGNQWNFPRPDVVDRWNAAGARVLYTGGQGAISILVQQDMFCVNSFREQPRIWREPAVARSEGCHRFDGSGK